MPVFWLNDHELSFPHPTLAEPGGLLAVGGDLSPERLILAYRNGIFPWFEDEGSFFWYSPDPRFVLFPAGLKIHKSMRSIFNRGKFRYTLDTCFERVIRDCAAASRSGQDGSWISEAFIEGYTELHRRGLAHSVEVWQGDELAGGLYGLSLGRIFFGESMFARETNASKAGFITLSQALQRSGFWLIDCQQETAHLASLGARGISRELFLEYLNRNAYERTLIGKWAFTEGGVGVR
ncbi:MAG: leucyl/phenylalanyl-tRNA--protein transferase [Saprospiraceae bacterium]|nr:leucyl/phenylalanyl-tRNA--protein transferase [Saprospiraceae bacterium]